MLHLNSPAKALRPISLVLLGALVPACHHGSHSTAGGGSGGSTPLTISNLAVQPGPNFAVVTWDTNLASDSRVDYGLTQRLREWHQRCFGGDEPLDPADRPHPRHRVPLQGLVEHRDRYPCGDRGRHVPDGCPGALLSDDFNRFNLNRAVWNFEDPHNRGVLKMQGAGTDMARVALTVPDNFGYNAEPTRCA
ncbi:MAG: hypothetical protein R3F17_03640 [Planctomycetota bacterium]